MSLLHRRTLGAAAAIASLSFTLVACGTGNSEDDSGATSSATIEVSDNHGTVAVPASPQRVVATDNRLFETLSDWGIELVAAPIDLIAADNPYKNDSDIVNLGNHREPDLEAVVAVEPDLIINGQRFLDYYGDFEKLAPGAAIVELEPRENEPFDAELKRQIEVLGQIFDREAKAQTLIDDFEASVERVKAAYDPNMSTMGLITSGGEINFAAPSTGRTLGPVFDILGLTPALTADGSTDHQGDDISVEAIAASNPDLILVMDRDAAVSANTGEESYVPANELLAHSAALKNVNAVLAGRIVYMPQFTYVNEGIQTYTQFFNSLADALEGN